MRLRVRVCSDKKTLVVQCPGEAAQSSGAWISMAGGHGGCSALAKWQGGMIVCSGTISLGKQRPGRRLLDRFYPAMPPHHSHCSTHPCSLHLNPQAL